MTWSALLQTAPLAWELVKDCLPTEKAAKAAAVNAAKQKGEKVCQIQVVFEGKSVNWILQASYVPGCRTRWTEHRGNMGKPAELGS